VEDLRKTPLRPHIQDDAINAMLGITHGNVSYAYTQQLNDFLRRSRQQLRVLIFNVYVSLMDWLIFSYSRPKPNHIVHREGTICNLWSCTIFSTTSLLTRPNLGYVKSTARPSTTHGGGQPTKKRTYEDPILGASKIWKRNNGASVGRGRGRRGGRG
jgi:hypothetical protein